jgi:hypothetical protein
VPGVDLGCSLFVDIDVDVDGGEMQCHGELAAVQAARAVL